LFRHERNDVWLRYRLVVTDGQRPIFVRVGSRIHGDKFLARHLCHCCEHAFVRDTPRLQLLLDHPLALRSKIASSRGLAAARRSDRGNKQILRDDSHPPKITPPARLRKERCVSFETRYRTAVTAFM
jgi:hypothetical protein